MDISMPGLNGIDACREILHAQPRTQVMMLTGHDTQEFVQASLDAGARAYVLKSDPPANPISAVTALRERSAFFSPRATSMLLEGYHAHSAGSSEAQTNTCDAAPEQLEVCPEPAALAAVAVLVARNSFRGDPGGST